MRSFMIAGLACLVAGCSGGSAGITITGKVTFSDGSPLTKGVLSITNDEASSRGAIKPDGTFTLEIVLDGEYLVAITGATEGGATTTTDDAESFYDQPAEPAKEVSLIAEKYSDPEKSGLTLKVPGDYDLQVEKP